MINMNIFEFSISAILRRGSKNISVVIILTMLIFLLSSMMLISGSIKQELSLTYNQLPDITIQKYIGGRVLNIENSRVDTLVDIDGIKEVTARVWGYYYFKNAGVNLSIIGIDPFETQYKQEIEDIAFINNDLLLKEDKMIIGYGVKKVFDSNYYNDFFNFILPDGKFKKVYIGGIFDSSSQIFSNDTILLNQHLAREIFNISSDMSSDITVNITNPSEIDTIASKIRYIYPDSRVITKDDIEISNKNIFNYKSGISLLLFSISLLTFIIIVYDKVSTTSYDERVEIGILKAIGWRVEDILKEKLYEGVIISIFAFTLGILSAIIFVYALQAPLLRDIFSGYSKLKPEFDLIFNFNIETFFIIFFITIPTYLASIIIPSWRIAIEDVDEALK